MALPKFQRIRPGTNAAQLLARVEDNMAAYASALTDERVGLLSHGLTVRQHFKGRVFTLTDVAVPNDWRDITASDMRNSWQLYPSDASPEAAYRLRIRKTTDGEVQIIGLGQPPTTSATGVVFAWPEGYTPSQQEIFTARGELQVVEVRTTSTGPDVTIRNVLSGTPAQGWVSFSGVRFAAATRSPPPWPSASQLLVPLGEDFPGLPEVVRVEDAVTAAGVHLGPCPVEWERTTAGKSQAIRIRRIDRLVPLTSHTLSLAVLAA